MYSFSLSFLIAESWFADSVARKSESVVADETSLLVISKSSVTTLRVIVDVAEPAWFVTSIV